MIQQADFLAFRGFRILIMKSVDGKNISFLLYSAFYSPLTIHPTFAYASDRQAFTIYTFFNQTALLNTLAEL